MTETIAKPGTSSVLSHNEQARREALETIIQRGIATFVATGEALAEMRESRLYRNTHDTFEVYCQEVWQIGASRARQLIGASETAKVLETVTTGNGLSERAIRPLVGLEPAQAQAAYAQASANGTITPTSAQMEQAAQQFKPDPQYAAYQKRGRAVGLLLSFKDGQYDILDSEGVHHPMALFWHAMQYIAGTEETKVRQQRALASVQADDPAHDGWQRVKTATQAHLWKPDMIDGWHEALCGKRSQEDLWPHIGNNGYFCKACEAIQKQPALQGEPSSSSVGDAPLTEAELATLARGGWERAGGEVGFLWFRQGSHQPIKGSREYWRNVIRGIESAEDEIRTKPNQELISAQRYRTQLVTRNHNLSNRKEFAAELTLVKDYYECLLTVAGLPIPLSREAIMQAVADLVDDAQFTAIGQRLDGVVMQ